MSRISPKQPRFNIPEDPSDMSLKNLEKYNQYIQARLAYLADTDGMVSAYDRACKNYEPYIVELEKRKQGEP